MVNSNNWDPVPWAIGGGAVHSVNVARLVSYAAFGGKEGIVGPDDLLVRELAVPGGGVRVLPGACAIHNSAAGIKYEAYACRLTSADTVDIPATGTGARSDMIVARVENPHIEGEPWDPPDDPAAGPYIRCYRIPDVGDQAETLADAGRANDSAIPLARIDIETAQTGTITNAMITDLRKMVSPRLKRIQRIINLPNDVTPDPLTSPAFRVFPVGANWTERIPEWAVRAQVVGWLASSRLIDVGPAGGLWNGRVRIQHGDLYTAASEVNLDVIGGGGSIQTAPTLMAAGDLYLPKDHRGTNRDLSFQGLRTNANNASLQADWGTTVVIEVTYYEDPDTQGWEQ
jgi:hypothetical protein